MYKVVARQLHGGVPCWVCGEHVTPQAATGSPTHDSVVLWTRLVFDNAQLAGLQERPVTVRWEVAHDEKFSRLVQTGQSQALAGLAHSVHVEVQGLEADRWYFYRFAVG